MTRSENESQLRDAGPGGDGLARFIVRSITGIIKLRLLEACRKNKLKLSLKSGP
jgi:hypothetical protein